MIIQPQDFRKKLYEEMNMDDEEIKDLLEEIIEEERFQEQMKKGFITYIAACPEDETLSIYNINQGSKGEILLEDEAVFYTPAYEYIRLYLSH